MTNEMRPKYHPAVPVRVTVAEMRDEDGQRWPGWQHTFTPEQLVAIDVANYGALLTADEARDLAARLTLAAEQLEEVALG